MSNALMQKVAEVAPQKYAFLVKTAEEVKQSPFRDEIVAELDGLLKKAYAPPSFMRRVGHGAMAIGGMAVAGVAANLAGDMYDAVKRGISKSRDYKSMMTENPDLADLPAKNVQKAFSALHRFNPEFAGEPTVAASFVRRAATLEHFDPQMLTGLVSARKNLHDIKKIPMLQLPSLNDELRANEAHGMNMQRAKQQMEMHPLQMKRTQQDLAHGAEEHKRRGEAHGMNMQRGPLELAKLKSEADMMPVRQEREHIGRRLDRRKLDQANAEDLALAAGLGIRARKALGL